MKNNISNKIVKNTTGIMKYDINSPGRMKSMSVVLKRHIVGNKLYTTIVGKNYAHVEGWQFAGGLLGIFPRVVNVENLSNGQEIKWKAEVEIYNLKNKEIIGRGFAICSNKESKKMKFDEYAILSMAQTRAIGKAYRNLIGWVMKLSGYESTPSEEMININNEIKTAPQEIKEEAQKIEAECHSCGNHLTKTEADYSKKIFKKILCRNCQTELRKK